MKLEAEVCRIRNEPHPNGKCQERFDTLLKAYDEAIKGHDLLKEIFNKIDSKKLLLLADWIDLKYPSDNNPEVQNDLRAWATMIQEIQRITKNES